ncbi:hypothetical protein [Paraburkholderia panacisoli]|uniref:hypothetical protein n=1 Tax=Paraburkholderia panacisoli TaxID=2603818 RepID=UPI00165F705A|nr:hypothetical protein [Paraburkholderia panacisoli]
MGAMIRRFDREWRPIGTGMKRSLMPFFPSGDAVYDPAKWMRDKSGKMEMIDSLMQQSARIA